MRSMRLECQNKYFPHGPKSQLIRALLTNKIVYDEVYRVRELFIVLVRYPVHTPGPYAGPYACVGTASQPIRSKNSFRISIMISIQ